MPMGFGGVVACSLAPLGLLLGRNSHAFLFSSWSVEAGGVGMFEHSFGLALLSLLRSNAGSVAPPRKS